MWRHADDQYLDGPARDRRRRCASSAPFAGDVSASATGASTPAQQQPHRLEGAGAPQDPSDAQLRAIKDRQGLELLEPEREEAIQDGALVFRIAFPLPSVSLIEIRPLS